MNQRIFATPFADVYHLYVAKVQRKGRTEDELRDVLTWLTGFSADVLDQHIEAQTTFKDFFDAAQGSLTPQRALITGSVCGVKVQEVADPLMKEIRLMDKVVDELAKGKAVEKIKREQ